ncbi:ABC transporter ATP-binding protein [Pseudidiomarina donghaiensis]|uniref:ABC transporter ATP-binding protein n=1 Tax=Pseudidiomarina donghaiensis TaxID=519452 RepID=A0A432XF61_9GAMM|nr:ABC transporter ATP-binding protein [Pseudidiomarina donghaiensis]RUO47399.1 ABC transporter ATP-binding protein [Pseudidiomarina donghaiensis]SFV22980.1 putative ABC transport system ATP-binding protein [Pseudidiomarina donghaiensis]
MTGTCIELKNLEFQWPGATRPLLSIPQFNVQQGERVLLRGASGSGKSTLLSLIAGIHAPAKNQLHVLEHDMGKLSQRQRDKLRANEIGYIFQQFNLLPYLTAVANVSLAAKFSPARRRRVNEISPHHSEHAKELLLQLGLDKGDLSRPAHQLSVGQQQRVAAARALFGSPALIIADEPTSALDADHRDNFIQVLFNACQQHNTTLLFVTHDGSLAHHFERSIELNEINQATLGHI